MNTETESLVKRWIAAFHEPPILIDPDLMRTMLEDVAPEPGEPRSR